MRHSALAVFLALVAGAAWAGSPSADGAFHFSTGGASGSVEFHARALGSSADGMMTMSATADVATEETEPVPVSITVRADIDCMKAEGKRAVMSGIVKDSSNPDYVGVRMILAVLDGGEGANADRDGFTWGVYHSNAKTWLPEDAEVPGDPGATFSWWATDAERPDDVGIQGGANAPTSVDCQSFGLDAYSFVELPLGSGNIQVRP